MVPAAGEPGGHASWSSKDRKATSSSRCHLLSVFLLINKKGRIISEHLLANKFTYLPSGIFLELRLSGSIATFRVSSRAFVPALDE